MVQGFDRLIETFRLALPANLDGAREADVTAERHADHALLIEQISHEGFGIGEGLAATFSWRRREDEESAVGHLHRKAVFTQNVDQPAKPFDVALADQANDAVEVSE